MPISESEKRYRQTPRGFLNRTYNGIKNRCTSPHSKKAKHYYGLEVMTWEEFLAWGLTDEFLKLYSAYLKSGKDRKLAPSVDRIDPSKGYVKGNIQWLTLSDNARRVGQVVKIPLFSFQILWCKY